MDGPQFPPKIEERFAALKARILRPPVDDWLKRCRPKNTLRLGQYFPTLEKLFDRGETAYNNEDWRQAWQDSFKVAEFIFKLKKEHNGWKQKLYQKETTRMLRVLAPKCIKYAEQSQIEIKREIAMEMQAQAARVQYQQELEQERARQAAQAAERSATMLRQEAKRAQEQGEEARASLATAQAVEAAQAAEYLSVPVVAVGGGNSSHGGAVVVASIVDNDDDSSGIGRHASVVDAAMVIDDGVPLAPPPTVTLREGQNVTYSKKGICLDATVIRIHHDQNQPYFTIRLPGGVEKQTTRQYLVSKINMNASEVQQPPPPFSSVPSAPVVVTPEINVNPGIDFSELGGVSNGNSNDNGNVGVDMTKFRRNKSSRTSQPPPPSYQPRGGTTTPPQPPPRSSAPQGPLYGQVRGPSSSSTASRATRPTSNASVGGWTINSKCDIQDRFVSRYTKRMVTQWRRGQILAINGTKVLVTFYNWPHEHDIWINMRNESGRLQPYGSKTAEVERQWQGRTLTFREQMENKGLRVVTQRGDGNCLFRSVAHQIWGDPERHPMVRTLVCDFMLANRGDFAEVLGALVPGPNGFERYVASMRRPCFQGNGEWGGDPEIRVMEEIFDRPFELWDVERGAQGPANIHLEGSLPEDHRVAPIRVSYHGKNHYNSVMSTTDTFPLGELNTSKIRQFRKMGTEKRSFEPHAYK
jgi:hypothetical protein